jgi:hypothetical protein
LNPTGMQIPLFQENLPSNSDIPTLNPIPAIIGFENEILSYENYVIKADYCY